MSCGKRFTVNGVLEQLFDGESDLEDNVSETEDCVEEDSDSEEFSSDANKSVNPPVVSQPPADTIPSKNGKIIWFLFPLQQQGKLSATNIKMVPGPTRNAVSCAEDIKSSLKLFITPTEHIVLGMTNLEGNHVYGDSWKNLH